MPLWTFKFNVIQHLQLILLECYEFLIKTGYARGNKNKVGLDLIHQELIKKWALIVVLQLILNDSSFETTDTHIWGGFLTRAWRLKVKFTLEHLSVSQWSRFFFSFKSLFAIFALTFGLRDEENVYTENTRLLKCWADGDEHKLSDRISVSKTDRWNVKS